MPSSPQTSSLFLAALLHFGCGAPESEREGPDAGLESDGGDVAGDGGPSDHQLSISVSGERNTTGDLCFAVFKDGEGYPDEGEKAVANGCVSMGAQPARTRLPPGRYGVSVFHDANSNETLDTGLFGIPTEGYGFSNDPSATFGAPDWDEVVFDFSGDRSMTLKLTYF